MTAKNDLPLPPAEPISAAELRQQMVALQMAKAEEAEAKRTKLEHAQMAQIQAFMEGHVDTEDLSRLRLHVQNAIAHGHTEVEVLRFPSSLLTDKGRAVNAGRSDWPSTLTGKAATWYELWETRAKPNGYGLEARILDYPGGLLGDVGLFMTWGGADA